MRQVMIETEDSARRGARRGRSVPKGRSFDALLVAHIEANGLWGGGAGGGDDVVRPVWALFACDEGARVPLVANLRCGRKAREYSDAAWGGRNAGRASFEFLRSVGYEFTTQRAPEGALVQVFHRGLFAFDPGVATDKVRGVLAPPRAWLDAQGAALGGSAAASASKAARERVDAEGMAPQDWITEPAFAALATLFAASLDRRLRAPLVPDLAFQGQLFAAALLSGFVALHRPNGARGWWSGTDAHGLHTDGLDAEAALSAAGAGEVDTLGGMGVGRQLYELLIGSV
jgi:hypothetical protein